MSRKAIKILLAPTALKGSLSAFQAAGIIQSALQSQLQDVDIRSLPLADGGNGTLDSLVNATSGEVFTAMVTGPLSEMQVHARWGVTGNGIAVVESAEAAGLHLLRPDQYDILHAATTGVGELIKIVLDAGYRRILIGLGGSATNDGGWGCVKALGARFLDKRGIEISPSGMHLAQIDSVDLTGFDSRIAESEITGLSDVDNILFGPEGAAYVFAPQKGATDEDVRRLDDGLRRYAFVLEKERGLKISNVPGSGAAGGLAAGLLAFCNARIVSGVDYILNAIEFDEGLQWCDLVITTEGLLDASTLRGKGIAGIVRRARSVNKPVHALVGRLKGQDLVRELSLASLVEISSPQMPVEEAIANAASLLTDAARKFAERLQDSMVRDR